MLLVACGLCRCKTGKIKQDSIWLLGQQVSPLISIKRRITWMLEESSERWEQSFIEKWLCYWEYEVELWGWFRIVIRYHIFRARYSLTGFPSGSAVTNWPAVEQMQEMWVQSLGWEYPLEEEVATHSSTLAWRIPWTEEPGGLQSTGSHRVRHDWSDWAYMCIH